MSTIAAIPKRYDGVLFRSTLEADWAATLNSLGIAWQYEPEAVMLPSGTPYRPDFYLPHIATWLEIKGPHGERLGKTEELARTVCHDPGCHGGCDGDNGCYWSPYRAVVIGLAPVRGSTDWRLIDAIGDETDVGRLTRCSTCGAWWWVGLGAYGCRACRRGGSGDDDFGEWIRAASDVLSVGDSLPFRRAS